MKNFKVLTLSASLLACGFGLSGNAQANAYAVATDNIQNGLLVALVNGAPQTDTSGNPTNGPNVIFGTPSSSSTTAATLNGTGDSHNAPGPNPDALPSNGPGSIPVRTNEMVTGPYYTLFGQLGTAYSWADAKVVSEQTLTGTPVEARAAAESNIPVSGFADANGTNSSSTAFTVATTVDVGSACNTTTTLCTIDIAFQADPYIQAILDAAAAGTSARGAISVSVTITPVGGGSPIFSWAPDGKVNGGIVGGVEVADGENLNNTQQALSPGVTQTFSDPYGTGVFSSFHAFTNPLTPGDYTLGLTMTVHTDVRRTTAVPEPASLALLGLGLAGLGLVRRRKNA